MSPFNFGNKKTDSSLYVSRVPVEFSESLGERKVSTCEYVSFNCLASAYGPKIAQINSSTSLGSNTPSTNLKAPFLICCKSRRSSTNVCTSINYRSIKTNLFISSSANFVWMSFILIMVLSKKSTEARGVRIS